MLRRSFSRIDSRPKLYLKELKSQLRNIQKRSRELKKDIDIKDVDTLQLDLQRLVSDWRDFNNTDWIKNIDNGELEFFYLDDRIKRLSKEVTSKVTSKENSLAEIKDSKTSESDNTIPSGEIHLRMSRLLRIGLRMLMKEIVLTISLENPLIMKTI